MKAIGVKIISAVVLVATLVFIIHLIKIAIDHEKLIVTVRFDLEQLTKLEEISKKECRDVKHTLLMLADDYIKYYEKDEVVHERKH